MKSPKIPTYSSKTKLWTLSLGKGATQRAIQSVYPSYMFKITEEFVARIIGIYVENLKASYS